MDPMGINLYSFFFPKISEQIKASTELVHVDVQRFSTGGFNSGLVVLWSLFVAPNLYGHPQLHKRHCGWIPTAPK